MTLLLGRVDIDTVGLG